MVALVNFIFFILGGLLSFLTFCLFARAIVSLLVMFNAINTYHPVMRQVVFYLDMITEPLIAPFRRFVPNMGGLDLSFLIAWLFIQGFQNYLLPAAYQGALNLVQGF